MTDPIEAFRQKVMEAIVSLGDFKCEQFNMSWLDGEGNFLVSIAIQSAPAHLIARDAFDKQGIPISKYSKPS